MATEASSEPNHSTAHINNKNVVYYLESLNEKITPEVRRLLEDYAHVPPERVVEHVHEARDRAWAVRSYPCTGLGRFLTPMIPEQPIYPEVVTRLKAGESMADIGAFIGQDLRRLVWDGAPSDKLYAVDIVSHWDVGYFFFQDQGRFSAQYVDGDILRPGDGLSSLFGKLNMININCVIHQWDIPAQKEASANLVALTKPQTGSLIMGSQVGTSGGRKVGPDEQTKSPYFMHSPATWRKMWAEVSEQTSTKWECDVQLRTWEGMGFDTKETAYLGEDSGMLVFHMRRIE